MSRKRGYVCQRAELRRLLYREGPPSRYYGPETLLSIFDNADAQCGCGVEAGEEIDHDLRLGLLHRGGAVAVELLQVQVETLCTVSMFLLTKEKDELAQSTSICMIERSLGSR